MRALLPLRFPHKIEKTPEKFIYHETINWFPGHMMKATREMRNRLGYTALVLEIRDARLPYSTANPVLEEMIGKKPHLIIFNKAELSSHAVCQKVESYYKKQNQSVLFTTGTNIKSVKIILSAALDKIKSLQHIGPAYMLVTGMPNVGKSTIINKLKMISIKGAKKVAKEGAHAGVTRQVSSFKISENPLTYLLDSPGIMVHKIEQWQNERGLKYALTGALKEHLVPDEVVADYLLHTLNVLKSTIYVKELGLQDTTDDINMVLKKIANKPGLEGKLHAARQFIAMYREGKLGRFTLDKIDANGGPIIEVPPDDILQTTIKK